MAGRRAVPAVDSGVRLAFARMTVGGRRTRVLRTPLTRSPRWKPGATAGGPAVPAVA